MNGSICPKCEKDIGVFSIMKAATPNRIKCPHCKAEVLYSNFPKLMLFLVGTFFVVSIISFIYIVRPTEFVFLIYVSLILIVGGALEYGMAKYLRKNFELRLK
jgi:hypothetical protein